MIVVPGKAMLCGEYAVLAGAPAIVGAVGRHAEAELCSGRDHVRTSPLVREAIANIRGHGSANMVVTVEHLAQFRPAAPKPTWRMADAETLAPFTAS